MNLRTVLGLHRQERPDLRDKQTKTDKSPTPESAYPYPLQRQTHPRSGSAKGTPTRKPAKKARRGAASKKVNGSARRGTKQAILIEMLRRPNGATIEQMTAKTGWQPHSVRGAISGNLKKKLGLPVTSEIVEGRGRVYRIAKDRKAA